MARLSLTGYTPSIAAEMDIARRRFGSVGSWSPAAPGLHTISSSCLIGLASSRGSR